MSSVKCPECKLTNWSTAITCKRCGTFLQPAGASVVTVAATAQNPTAGYGAEAKQNSHQPAPSFEAPVSAQTPVAMPMTSYQNQSYQQDSYQYQSQEANYQHYQQPNYQYYQQANLKSGMAIASMILGILGMATSIFVIGVLFSPIGLILGIIALIKANKKPDVYGGKGFAIAGVATSAVIVLFVPILMAIAIPNLMAARRAANEGSAFSTMKTLANAEATYIATSSGKCGDVQTLVATKLIDVNMAKSEKSGYRFLINTNPAGGCEILATPLSESQGTRSFYYSTLDGVLRAGTKKGLPADKNDLPLNAGSMNQPGQYQNTSPQRSSY